jgi:2-C-methyl-D-erythritol 4-phosphate cytidylyltransferase
MYLFALIVAGGVGKRMGTDVPKQFLILEGMPVLMHTISRFRAFDKSIEIVIVLPENQFSYWKELCKQHSFSIHHKLVAGGSSRFMSVKNGLKHVGDNSLVAIHDGVRPLVSLQTIVRCFKSAEKHGNAVPVIIPADSLRTVNAKGSVPSDRNLVRIIQTPQVFKSELIKKAYRQKYNSEFTDDATVLEKTGIKIHMVDGNRENIKITNPEDLLVASALLHFVS